MTIRDEWELPYVDMMDTAQDTGVIPLFGVRILVGVTEEGRKQFFYELDSDTAHVNQLTLIGALDITQHAVRHDTLVQMGLAT